MVYLDAINPESEFLNLRDPKLGRSIFRNTQLGLVDVPVRAEADAILIFTPLVEHCAEAKNTAGAGIALNIESHAR